MHNATAQVVTRIVRAESFGTSYDDAVRNTLIEALKQEKGVQIGMQREMT